MISTSSIYQLRRTVKVSEDQARASLSHLFKLGLRSWLEEIGTSHRELNQKGLFLAVEDLQVQRFTRRPTSSCELIIKVRHQKKTPRVEIRYELRSDDQILGRGQSRHLLCRQLHSSDSDPHFAPTSLPPSWFVNRSFIR